MIQREAKQKLIDLAKKFKAVAVTGARQTGKTTLIKEVFKTKPYVSLENLDMRNFALEDPRGFLANYPHGAVLDEVQRTPNLFSYLQEILDNSEEKGLFILSGSNNFLLQQSISQSLAGRIGYINLLPFSLAELHAAKILPQEDDELMLKGFYPPVYDQDIPPVDWCPNYIRTYIEKDVRQIKNISNLVVFEKFIRLLAGRTGQELNNLSLSNEIGVDVKTIQSWIGILESSFIIYLLRPHFKNFNKTIIKRPKVYFYDTSIVCSLLGIQTAEQMRSYPLRGAIFETMVMGEFVKKRTHAALPINLFYWRDSTGHEIDLIIDNVETLLPVEIKSSKTITKDFFKNLDYWCKLSGESKSVLMYAGTQTQARSNGTAVRNWRELISLEI